MSCKHVSLALTGIAGLSLAAVGCGVADRPQPKSPVATGPTPTATSPADDAVAEERTKLSPDDRALVDAQEWCVVSTDERLGSMGPPIKLTVKDQTVFVCCKGCKRKAEADPDKTLATLDELKGKAKAARDAKK